jgi:hypothetical protein
MTSARRRATKWRPLVGRRSSRALGEDPFFLRGHGGRGRPERRGFRAAAATGEGSPTTAAAAGVRGTPSAARPSASRGGRARIAVAPERRGGGASRRRSAPPVLLSFLNGEPIASGCGGAASPRSFRGAEASTVSLSGDVKMCGVDEDTSRAGVLVAAARLDRRRSRGRRR